MGPKKCQDYNDSATGGWTISNHRNGRSVNNSMGNVLSDQAVIDYVLYDI
jgi:hypothetical protein